jgi:hypothetical protein
VEVRYEALHTDGLAVLRELSEWAGVHWAEADLQKALEANSPEVARAGGGTPIPLSGAISHRKGSIVNEPEGFVRQARAGTWRQELTWLDRVAVWRVAHATMAEVGYPWSTPWSA